MLYLPAGFAPVLFGVIATQVGGLSGNKKLGFHLQLVAAITLLCVSLLLVLFLPAGRALRKRTGNNRVKRS